MIADKESGLITRSSDKRLIGYAPEAIGIDEENAFVDSYNKLVSCRWQVTS